MALTKARRFISSILRRKTPERPASPQITLFFTTYLPKHFKKKWPQYEDPFFSKNPEPNLNVTPSNPWDDNYGNKNFRIDAKQMQWQLRHDEYTQELNRQNFINNERGGSGLTDLYGDETVGGNATIEQSEFTFSEQAKLREGVEFAIYSIAKKGFDIAKSGRPKRGIEGVSIYQPKLSKEWTFHEVYGFADDLKRFTLWFGTIRPMYLTTVRAGLEKMYHTLIDPSTTLTFVDVRQALIAPSSGPLHDGLTIYVGSEFLKASTPISYIGDLIYRDLLLQILDLNLYQPDSHEPIKSVEACKNLAKMRPQSAIKNIENWMLFINSCQDPTKSHL